LAKGKDEEENTLNTFVQFQEITESDRDAKYDKFVSLIEENKSAFPLKIIIKRGKKQVVFDSKQFAFNITFGKKVLMSIMIHNLDKNKTTANEVGSKITNYLNAILGEKAVRVRVGCVLLTSVPKKGVNMAERILGEGRIAKVSELTGHTLKPNSIGFEFKKGERDFMFSTYANHTYAQIVGSNILYKDKIPFDFLEKEINELNNPISIIKRLTEGEL
jgi:hypothetical protein